MRHYMRVGESGPSTESVATILQRKLKMKQHFSGWKPVTVFFFFCIMGLTITPLIFPKNDGEPYNPVRLIHGCIGVLSHC